MIRRDAPLADPPKRAPYVRVTVRGDVYVLRLPETTRSTRLRLWYAETAGAAYEAIRAAQAADETPDPATLAGHTDALWHGAAWVIAECWHDPVWECEALTWWRAVPGDKALREAARAEADALGMTGVDLRGLAARRALSELHDLGWTTGQMAQVASALLVAMARRDDVSSEEVSADVDFFG